MIIESTKRRHQMWSGGGGGGGGPCVFFSQLVLHLHVLVEYYTLIGLELMELLELCVF